MMVGGSLIAETTFEALAFLVTGILTFLLAVLSVRRLTGPDPSVVMDKHGIRDFRTSVTLPWAAVKAVKWVPFPLRFELFFEVDSPENYIDAHGLSRTMHEKLGKLGAATGGSTIKVSFLSLKPSVKEAMAYANEMIERSGKPRAA